MSTWIPLRILYLLAEEGATRLSDQIAGAELLSSVLLVLESSAIWIRLARASILKANLYETCINRVDQDRELFILRDLTLDLCASNLLPPVATPRSLDLAHLRTALWFRADAPIERFVTLDESQAQAAKELGLPV